MCDAWLFLTEHCFLLSLEVLFTHADVHIVLYPPYKNVSHWPLTGEYPIPSSIRTMAITHTSTRMHGIFGEWRKHMTVSARTILKPAPWNHEYWKEIHVMHRRAQPMPLNGREFSRCLVLHGWQAACKNFEILPLDKNKRVIMTHAHSTTKVSQCIIPVSYFHALQSICTCIDRRPVTNSAL